MKTIYIEDLQKSQLFEKETFAIYDSKSAEDKNGNTYYSLIIGDKTGRVQAKIWSDALSSIDRKALKSGKLIAVTGKVDEYKGALQINIMGAAAVSDTEMDDFVNSSEFSADEMYAELLEVIEHFKDKSLAYVVRDIITDEDVKRRLMYWPAATMVHHEFRSGLIQHILEMLTVAKGLEKFYPDVNFDILNSGILLHDIGKLYELDGNDLAVPYTTQGELLGHIYIGAKLFESKAEGKIDDNTRLHVTHLILSHHGKREYGAPVLPSTVEAQMLYNIDNVSAKARTADSIINNMPADQEFSQRAYFLENTKIWNTKNVKTEEAQADVKEAEDNSDVLEEDQDQIPLV